MILNDTRYTREELLRLAVEKIKGADGNTYITPSWEADLYRFIIDFFNEEKTLFQQTSGTTGESKTIPLNREAMQISAQRTLEHFGLQPGDSALLCLPVQYIAGKMMVVRALVGGLNLVTTEPTGKLVNALKEVLEKDEHEAHDLQKTTKIDFAAMVPLQVFELLKSPDAFSGIDTLIIGGGEIDPVLRQKIRRLKGISVYETFAMSETYTHFATRRMNESTLDNSYTELRHAGRDKDISIEKQSEKDVKMPEAQSAEAATEDSFQIMDGVKAELDERGCLVVDIPGVTNGPVVSNDLAEFTGSRSFRWLGRLDNVIKTGGIKVIPETIEAVVKELTGREAVVLGVPDQRLGQKLVLVLEGTGKEKESNSHPAPLKPDRIIEALQPRLATHEIPKEIRFLPEFPRNRSMKIDRNEIRQLLGMD